MNIYEAMMGFFILLMWPVTSLVAAFAIVAAVGWILKLATAWLPENGWGCVLEVAFWGVCLVAATVVMAWFVLPGIHDFWMDVHDRYRATCCYV